MKSVNDKVLEKTKKAMEYSNKVSKKARKQSYEILNAPVDVKIKRSKSATCVGSLLVVVGAVSYVYKVNTLATGIFLGGCVTVGSNLLAIKRLKNK